MKKTLAIICAAIIALSCVFLSGCGESKPSPDSQYIGTWKAVTAGIGDEIDPAEEVFTNGFVFTLNADGTAIVNSDGQEEKQTWTETSKGVKIDGMEYKNEDGKLTANIIGVKIVFEKQ